LLEARSRDNKTRTYDTSTLGSELFYIHEIINDNEEIKRQSRREHDRVQRSFGFRTRC
jgi:hypothetical protein